MYEQAATMRAMVYRRYGSPDVLRMEEIPRPVPTGDQVLVRIRATALNPLDWHLLRGIPYIVRPSSGWRTPKRTIPGVDVAGTVEAVGPDVTELAPGDEVWAEKARGCAEYVAGAERLWVRLPDRMSHQEAAGLPAAGVTALQALRDKGQLRPGQRVLVNGASGGVGTYAVQIAKADGAEVTGVCSTRNVELVSSLGADHVIDYTAEDFTRDCEPYDLIIDNAANRSLRSMGRVLAPKGTLVLVGASKGRWVAPMARMVAARLIGRFGDQRLLGHLTETRREDLLALKDLVEAGKLRTIIDRCYPLDKTPEAIRYLETMRARGKVIVTP